jgi:metalloendopeptidase OMA1, mitochondrial
VARVAALVVGICGRGRGLALTVLVLVAVACQTVPITGRRELLLLPESSELSMGLTSYQDVLKKSKISTDPALNAQVTRVGRRIAEATGRKDYQWEFKVIEESQANAFCLPGGKVAVYTGILPIARDDAGLAAVLGHEVSHAIARHGGERVTQGLLVQTGLAATQVALANHDPLVVQSVTALLGAGASVGLLLPWGRAQESEADHLGLVYMARAGYHPSAARDLWMRMQEAAKGQQRPPAFLATHPSAETRIQQIDGWMPEALAEYRPR